MKFIIKCAQCGDQNQLNDDERASIQTYYHKGSPSIKDRMVLYCENCGNKEEYGISWPIDINTPNQSPDADKAIPCGICGADSIDGRCAECHKTEEG